MEDQSTEKQHQASARRIEDLRKKGQTMRSRDLSGGLAIIIVVIMLFFLSEQFKVRLEHNFIWSFKYISQVMLDDNFPASFIGKLAYANFIILMPIFIVSFISIIMSPFLFGGWNFTLQAIQFKFEKLDPITNLKNIFSKRIFIEVLRSLLKVIIVSTVFIIFILSKQTDIKILTHLPLLTAIKHLTSILSEYIITLCGSVILIVIFDILYHFYEFTNRVKMTTQELKDESKETDGNADTKRRQRSQQMALLKQRLTVTVPKANVIVTNPTHYSIALKYDERKDSAPKVVAKGKGFLAQQIRHIAITNGIPIYQAPVVARAIYHTSQIGKEVHPDLYMPVAIILSYIHQLKNYQHGVGQLPKFVTDFKIPSELIYDE